MAKVQVLGTGCSKCRHLLKNAQAAASERQAGDVVEKIEDYMQMFEFNPVSAAGPGDQWQGRQCRDLTYANGNQTTH